ncbi:hypothetical protein BZB76_4944 [Actinomadura pelletieri DSM 43383]|uniref:Uncharacterized protein n=1 Tax=Actinomadura pelletieri DSM 43383 TaxID=1120940 RepID=A0A495QJ05_9ACTN|nr:hypothetical protein [Actinomadura pelletieri]RKS72127.1 hypothetical protein BZB76_4944 [Actinomadura pelletieri DSM 43383]
MTFVAVASGGSTASEDAAGGTIVVTLLLLVVALAVLLPLRAWRPTAFGRLRWWVLGIVGGGLVTTLIVDPLGVLVTLFLTALLMIVAWPVVALAAVATGVWAVRSGIRPGQAAARATWVRLVLTWFLALLALYGYGLMNTRTIEKDPGDACRFSATGYQPDGSMSLLPLSDTTCGADSVPGFVNPLLMLLTALLVICVIGAVASHLQPDKPE